MSTIGKTTRALVALAAIATSAPLAAAIVDIAWDANRQFDRRLEVAPGKFAEVCGKLAKGDSVRWEFEAAGALDFNIHYHVGKDVEYPARKDAADRMQGTLSVDRDQDYCWMWTNKAAHPVGLRLRLSR